MWARIALVIFVRTLFETELTIQKETTSLVVTSNALQESQSIANSIARSGSELARIE